MTTHEAAGDPHSQYLTSAEGDALFLTPAEGDTAYINVGGDAMTGALTTITPTLGGHATNMTYVDGVMTTHEGLTDPHSQ